MVRQVTIASALGASATNASMGLFDLDLQAVDHSQLLVLPPHQLQRFTGAVSRHHAVALADDLQGQDRYLLFLSPITDRKTSEHLPRIPRVK